MFPRGAASLLHANGRVGTYGFSYDKATQLQAALGRPPSLRTICPGFTGSQYYEGWPYNGDAFALAFNASWATNRAMDEARRRGDGAAAQSLLDAFLGAHAFYRHLPPKEYSPLVGSGLGRYFFDWMAHPSYDDYWRRWSVDEDHSRIDAPALHTGGWYDAFVNGTVKNYGGLRREAASEASRSAQKLLVGPWYHPPWSRLTGATDFVPQARNSVDGWQMRWFDQFLREEDTGDLGSPVTFFSWATTGGWIRGHGRRRGPSGATTT